ncbi:MAG: hypothetical protein IJU30_03995 [Lachnospiraceae bacterium]|nr:hypothetical protein [Lachnospiraceae bacterium]
MEKMNAGPCGRLQQKLETPCAVFLSGECSADIMTGVLRQLSALITSRYHAAVLSMDGGCPIAAVSMDERLDSLMRENALEENYLFSVSEADLGNRVAAAVTEGMEHRDEIRGYLKERVAKYQEMQREMGAFLKNYLLNGPGHGSEK